MHVVFFSSTSENTKRFVDKLDFESTRLPLRRNDPEVHMDEPYVLVVPTYGGGGAVPSVPRQVIKFLNDEGNRSLIRGVVATGNTNFGVTYGLAGRVVSAKTGVPLLGSVELLGTDEDIERITKEIQRLGAKH